MTIVRTHLARSGTATFRALTAGCEHTLEVVARFLALLELYRQQRVSFEQLTPLGELHVRWTGTAAPEGSTEAAPAPGADVDEEYG
jgi:segregation and condensation protein A